MTELNEAPIRGRAAVAAANPLAAAAGLAILRAGGSAVDAAIAAQAALTVVEPNASGIGGGAVILVHEAGATIAFDGIAAAPGEVPERLETDFNGRTVPSDRAVFGGRTVGVPGALRALEDAHRRFGRLPWRALFAPAIELAAEGFALAPYVVRTLLEIPVMRDEAMAKALYWRGSPPDRPASSAHRRHRRGQPPPSPRAALRNSIPAKPPGGWWRLSAAMPSMGG
ncbi:MAG: gamma-glutamyltransferase [Alphaproteobacteria bacterium]|nr:gamma-glutamyltransferase [Alphaproteobacteria bacterium]